MSLKRSQSGSRSSSGAGGDSGGNIDRQELYDQLRKFAETGQAFAAVDVAMATGAAEPTVSRSLLGFAAEGLLEKVDAGKYKATSFKDISQAEFLKAYARASKMDSTRVRELSEISRLKQNNDVMRAKLLAAIAERDHYLQALKRHGIDPGPLPAPSAVEVVPPPIDSP